MPIILSLSYTVVRQCKKYELGYNGPSLLANDVTFKLYHRKESCIKYTHTQKKGDVIDLLVPKALIMMLDSKICSLSFYSKWICVQYKYRFFFVLCQFCVLLMETLRQIDKRLCVCPLRKGGWLKSDKLFSIFGIN